MKFEEDIQSAQIYLLAHCAFMVNGLCGNRMKIVPSSDRNGIVEVPGW